MALLGRAAWLLRSFSSWPSSYSALLISFISHAIASIIKAAFFFYPTPTKRVPEDQESVVVAEEAVEGEDEQQKEEKGLGGKTTGRAVDMEVNLKMDDEAEAALGSMVTSLESQEVEADPGPRVFSLTGDRVPFSLVPKNTGLGPSMGNPSSNFRIAGTQLQSLSSPPSSLFKTSSPRSSPASSPRDSSSPKMSLNPREVSLCSPRDPSSIVDMYCDDEFALSLEFHPNMLLYPVQGVSSSMEAELTKIDGSFLSMSLNSTHSSLVSSYGEEEVVSVLSVSPPNS